MSKFGSTQELYARIGEHLQKLKHDTLQVEDFENLLLDARELYERAQILRYKAFERHVSGEKVDTISLTQEPVETPITLETKETENAELRVSIPKDTEQIIVASDEPSFEFALFGEVSDVPTHKNDLKVDLNESELQEKLLEDSNIDAAEDNKISSEEPVEIVKPEILSDIPKTEFHSKVVEVRMEEQKITTTGGGSITSSGSLLDRFASSQSSRLADQLKNSRITSIVSSLNLNDRIRFAKNLFAGNSESFNSAVQLLDAQNSKMEAFALLGEYAERFNWDQDDKNTMDFYELVERRHA